MEVGARRFSLNSKRHKALRRLFPFLLKAHAHPKQTHALATAQVGLIQQRMKDFSGRMEAQTFLRRMCKIGEFYFDERLSDLTLKSLVLQLVFQLADESVDRGSARIQGS